MGRPLFRCKIPETTRKHSTGIWGRTPGAWVPYVPEEILSKEYADLMMDTIFIPTIQAMEKEGRPFSGVIYFGLMLTENGPKVIEYNARFGDPETQAILPLLETDLFDIIDAVLDQKLDQIEIKWAEQVACCVVMASGGYPSKYETGYAIDGLDKTDCLVFHAGTRFSSEHDKTILTSGGRVLGVTAVRDNLQDAIDDAYQNVARITFKNMHFRHDIGKTI